MCCVRKSIIPPVTYCMSKPILLLYVSPFAAEWSLWDTEWCGVFYNVCMKLYRPPQSQVFIVASLNGLIFFSGTYSCYSTLNKLATNTVCM